MTPVIAQQKESSKTMLDLKPTLDEMIARLAEEKTLNTSLQTYTPKRARPEKQEAQAKVKELVFNRSEKKYLISSAAAEKLIRHFGESLKADKRGSTLIRNLYLDTPDYLLIRRSIEKPLYKEKLRIRTYGAVSGPQHEAFLEIKKKLEGQVYKRRLSVPLNQIEGFIKGEYLPEGQIAKELSWSCKQYEQLEPAISVIYQRKAYSYPGLEGEVRLTFDYDLAAKPGVKGDFYRPFEQEAYSSLLPQDYCIMEIKALGAMPLELTRFLSSEKIFPTSFSKVGTAYKHFYSKNLLKSA